MESKKDDTNKGYQETRISRYRKRMKSLDSDYDTWRPKHKDIADFIAPNKGRYLSGLAEQANDGTRKDRKIINATASESLRIGAAGMQGGLTSPSRAWFALGLQDKDLMEYTPVRMWLRSLRDAMMHIFAKSNFYGATHNTYSELLAFATAAMLIEKDYKTVIRCRPFTIGEYMLALDSSYRPNTLCRRFSMTAYQLIEKFGIDNVSDSVKTAYKSNNGDRRFNVNHILQPNGMYDMGKEDARGKKYESVYYEDSVTEDKFLRTAGYRTIPFTAPRWDVNGVDTYGTGCGDLSLGDVKMLQKMEEKKLKKIDKNVDPPMNAPTAMKKKGGSIISGGINYVDRTQGQQAFEPAYHPDADIQSITYEIDRVERRIQRFFFNDLFLAIIQQDKQMTATEVAERHTEKLLMLGPVIERIQSEFLDVVIDRTFDIMMEMNLITPPPEEMQGMDIKIEYISMLAQAQKMVGITAIEQTAGFAGSLLGMYPEARHKFNPLEAIDEYAEMVGSPPKMIRSDDEVEALIQADREAALAAQQQQQAGQLVQGAKVLSETKLNEGTALDVLTGGAGR